jgi:hypothetical protein
VSEVTAQMAPGQIESEKHASARTNTTLLIHCLVDLINGHLSSCLDI